MSYGAIQLSCTKSCIINDALKAGVTAKECILRTFSMQPKCVTEPTKTTWNQQNNRSQVNLTAISRRSRIITAQRGQTRVNQQKPLGERRHLFNQSEFKGLLNQTNPKCLYQSFNISPSSSSWLLRVRVEALRYPSSRVLFFLLRPLVCCLRCPCCCCCCCAPLAEFFHARVLLRSSVVLQPSPNYKYQSLC